MDRHGRPQGNGIEGRERATGDSEKWGYHSQHFRAELNTIKQRTHDLMDKTADMLDLLFRAFTTHQDAFKEAGFVPLICWIICVYINIYVCVSDFICVFSI